MARELALAPLDVDLTRVQPDRDEEESEDARARRVLGRLAEEFPQLQGRAKKSAIEFEATPLRLFSRSSSRMA